MVSSAAAASTPERRLDRLATELEDVFLEAELLERVEGRLDDVGRVARAERLGEQVLDAGRFDHGADAATGDEAGTGRGRTEKHAATAELAEDFVRNGVALEGNGFEMLAGRISGFADGFGDFVGLAESDADLALAIADDEERAEAEATATLDDLGASIDENDFFEKVGLVFVTTAARSAIAAGSTTTAAWPPRPPWPRPPR